MRVWRGRRLVLGTGTAPRLPAFLESTGPALHSADYLAPQARAAPHGVDHRRRQRPERSRDLRRPARRAEAHGFDLTWLTRSPRFFPMEYTKLTLEMTSPGWIVLLPGAARRGARRQGPAARALQGRRPDTINAIFDELYRRQATGGVETTLLTATEVTGGAVGRHGYSLDLRHTEQETEGRMRTESLVLATGYRRVPAFLEPVRDRIRLDDRGRFLLTDLLRRPRRRRDLRPERRGAHARLRRPRPGHGRPAQLDHPRRRAGPRAVPVEKRIAFQEFGMPDRYRTCQQDRRTA